MKDVKVLLVGDDTYDMYVKAFYHAYIREGYENVELFATNRYLDISGEGLIKYFRKAENKFAFGPGVRYVNRLLLRKVDEMKPNLVFLYSARLICGKTVKRIKEKGSTVFIYNNDDAFAEFFPKYFWRHYRNSLCYADVGFAYRLKNITDYQQAGCSKVELLRSYYIKERNYYIENSKVNVPGVVFLGHYENDGREKYIKALLDKKIEVGITKQSWENFESGNPYLKKLENSHELYNEMLNAAKIAVVFLSTINHDTYTRRCFEIPAVKTLMVAPYTDDLATMFRDGEEVVFYRNKQDFVDKIEYYLEHEEDRVKIAESGYCRVNKDGHEVCDRIRQIMHTYEKLIKDKE